jgi:hypothetical protein
LVLSLVSVQAQFGPPTGKSSPGPGLSGSTAKLFGENSAFSASLEMQTSAANDPDTMSMPGKIYFDQGKSRFEMDMSQIKSAKIPPQMAAQMKSMGMDKMIVISRPDKKVGYQIYPGMQAYLESPLPDKEAGGQSDDYKLEMTELGKETLDGHPCIKNKAVVTEKDGTKHESLIWNAEDLKKFPLKIEQTQENTKVTMLFRDLKLSKPGADLFDPPAGVTKYDSMQSMMQQIMMKQFGGARPAQGQ